MKKLLITLSVFLVALGSLAQYAPFPPPTPPTLPKIDNRGSPSVINNDARLQAQFSLYVPRYPDTSHANIANNIGADSCGALIFTYDINNFWVRACNPKRWVRVSNDQILPDGVYNGGDVFYSGVGYDYIVTAATFVLNHVIYNTPQGDVILDPSDPTFGRIDVIGLTPTGPGKITGTPSANPLEKSANPLTFIRRSIVQVAANSVAPTVVQNVIYDQGEGSPNEWNIVPIAPVDFFDLGFPYHLTIAALASGFTQNDTIKFINTDTIHSGGKNTLIGFARLSGELPSDVDLNFQLLYQGNPVSQLVPFSLRGLNRSLLNNYQAIAAPFPEFGPSDIIFDEVDIVATGNSDIPAFRVDYIQMQAGLLPVFGGQNAFTSIVASDGGSVIANSPSTLVNMVSAGGLFIFANDNTKTVTISGIGLIRNDLLWGTPQPSSAVSVDGYVKVTNSAVLNGALTIQGNQSGLGGLVKFQSDNTNCCAYVDYNYYNIQENISPSAVNHSLITLRLGRRDNAFFESGFINYMYDGNTASTSHIGISFVNPDMASPIPFTFGADSSFKILRPALGGDNSFKLDVGAKSRLLDAYQANYASSGARITDSTLLWKQAIDSLIAAGVAAGPSLPNIGSGFRILLPSTGYKTLFVTNGIFIDSSTNTNGLTLQTDSSTYTTRLRTQKIADSLVAVISASNHNVNIGAFYRLTVPNTNNVKTIAVTNGILADSSSNTNAITLQSDSTKYGTKLFVQHIADSLSAVIAGANNNANVGAGIGWAIAGSRNIRSIVAGANITLDASNPNQITIAATAGSPGTLVSFGFTDANGIAGNVINSTTTPNLTLRTTVTANQVFYSTGTAFAGSTAFLFNPTNQRVSIGAASGATAYLNLNPSTAIQASLNLGNAGVNPSFPNNGDVWVNTNHIMARLGGLTFQLDQQIPIITINSTPIASGTVGRLLFQSAANQVSQSANLFWDNTNNRLRLNGANVAAALSLPASTTVQAPINLGNAGTAPAAPNNADLWVSANHLNVRLNGTTFQLDQQGAALTVNTSPIAAGVPGRLLFQNAANQLSQTANLFYNVGSSALQINGATTVAALSLPASTTAQASINFGNAGAAPSAPVNGDAWIAANNLFIRLNGVNVQLSNPVGGTVTQLLGVINRITVSNGGVGVVTVSTPQDIATTSAVQFQRVTVGGSNALPSFVINASTDPTAAPGVITNTGTRLAISFAATYKRFVVTNDVAPVNGSMPIGNGVDYTNAVPASGNNNLIVTVGAGTWSIRPNSTFTALTDAASVIWDANTGYNKIWNVGGTGRILAISNAVNGTTYVLKLVNTTGSASITTWPSGTIWPSGTAPTLPAVAGAIIYVALTFDGTNYAGAYNPNRYQ